MGGIFTKHVKLSLFGDKSTGTTVAGCGHNKLGLKSGHLFGLSRFGLSPYLAWEKQLQDFNTGQTEQEKQNTANNKKQRVCIFSSGIYEYSKQ